MSKSKTTQSPCAVWDFRYNADTFTDEKGVIKMLELVAKKWVFQLEEGDSGYRHYQGRLSLIKKRRQSEKHILLKLLKEAPPNYIEPTNNVEFLTGDMFYVTKEDTRLAGPWRDDDEIKYETRQLKEFLQFDMYEWQKQIIGMIDHWDGRKIDLIYDKPGCIGKSMISEYLEFNGLAEEIPPYRLMDDIFQWVCSRPIKKAYLVDMPKGMKKDKLGDLYSGLEVIKNGVAYDKRYTAKKIRFDRPRIFVFTNELPQFKLMSLDRWQVWEINRETMAMEPYTPKTMSILTKPKINEVLNEQLNPLQADFNELDDVKNND